MTRAARARRLTRLRNRTIHALGFPARLYRALHSYLAVQQSREGGE
mgnify:CR=1 FL=1|tara:strand:+ start:1189 stop:1326 length:138 start_codon:yes stop_codon:yes gene_type:complete